MRRRPWIPAGTLALLTLVTSLATNYATQFGPTWTRNPWIIWPVLAVLMILSAAGAVIVARRPEPLPASPAGVNSLRPPTLDFTVRGREDELSRLTKLIKNPRGHFAVVCGPRRHRQVLRRRRTSRTHQRYRLVG